LLERPTFFGPRVWEERTESLRLTALGPLRLFRNGQEVEPKAFKRRKARELLALLLNLRGGFASKEELCDTLFPDSLPKAAVRDLRVALHSLFEVPDPERPHNATARCLERREDRYSLPWTDAISVDVRDFEQALERESPELWQRALGLYRGDYLEDFPYAEWAQPTRERLRALYVRTAERLARWHLEQGHEEQALELAHSILQRDRCWEGAYQLLMSCHLRSGRSVQAARIYDQCAEALKDELGVEPSEETEALYQRALG
jgi:DNA-binding SARP family transcriptional activator